MVYTSSLSTSTSFGVMFALQMGQALWRLPPRQQQQLQEELADRLADRGGGRQDQGNITLNTFLCLAKYCTYLNLNAFQ